MKNEKNQKTVKLAIYLFMVVLVMFSAKSSYSQNNMAIGAGVDIMMPVAVLSNNWTTGFGGTAEFDYAITHKSYITGKIGYISWSAKDQPAGISSSFNGVPLLIGLKYFVQFIPQNLGFRLYFHTELGALFSSVSVSGSTLAKGSESATDYAFVPSIGTEIPVSDKGAVDFSFRYLYVFKKSSLGLRLGYRMSI